MRTLVILRGAPGCGKSTWIEKNNLSDYTLSADQLRFLIKSPVLQADGSHKSVLGEDKYVWELLHKLLEKRMQSGEFTVIDATHSKVNELGIYKQLCLKYRYRLYCVDFSDVSLETCIEQNSRRVDYKRVPDYAIKRVYDRIIENKTPSYITNIKPEEFSSVVEWSPMDLSKYEEIVHIGDIHGCMTVLHDFFNGEGLDSNKYYIFLGDYIDRGIENKEVVEFLMTIVDAPNVCLLEGNHERYMWSWGNDIEIRSDLEFMKTTAIELGNSKQMKQNLRKICRKLRQMIWYTYNGQEVFCCHGGISSLERNPLYIPTNILIGGTGEYEDTQLTEATFNRLHPDVIQVHGHRNIENLPIKTITKNYNLEGKVEFGGNLRVMKLSKAILNIMPYGMRGIGISCTEIRNNVYAVSDFECNVPIHDVHHLIELMRKSSIIKETQFAHISSFNFKPIAFYDSLWGGVSTKARGLFINTEDEKIVARSYDKFFNFNEKPETTLPQLRENLKFPLHCYVKENGFLGILGYDDKNDNLLFCSKSTMAGQFSKIFKHIVYKSYYDKLDDIKAYLRDNDCTMVFEVIDPFGDPHIVKYGNQHVVLLDIIYNRIHFEELPYEQLEGVATELGLNCKKRFMTINSFEELEEFITTATTDITNTLEGYVIQDAEGFQFKIKLPYYNILKKLRSVTDTYNRLKMYEVREDEYLKPYVEAYLSKLLNNLDVLSESYTKFGKVNINFICEKLGFDVRDIKL